MRSYDVAEEMASAVVQGNQADFDFNGSGFVDMDDIVQLFVKVTTDSPAQRQSQS